MRPHLLRRCAVIAGLCAAAALPAADDGYDQEGRAGFGAFVVPPSLEDLAERDLAPGDGAIVVHVRPGSTAESLGIKPGDVIRSINDTAIQTRRDVRGVVRSVSPGDEATVVVTGSDGVTRTLDGTFKERLPRPAGRPAWPWMMNPNGAPPPWDEPEDVIAAQRQQLLDERTRLDAIAADLAVARAALPPDSGAWVVHVSVRQE